MHSGSRTASASTPARAAARVPLPVHSSSITPTTEQLAGQRGGVGLEQRLDGQRDHREAGLHVAGAAAVHPAVAHHRLERRRRPALGVAGRDDVDVAVQEQRAALARPRPDDQRPARVGLLRDARAAGLADRLGHVELADVEAEPLELGAEDALRAGLVADRARLGDQAFEEGEGLRGQPLDGRVQLSRIHLLGERSLHSPDHEYPARPRQGARRLSD